MSCGELKKQHWFKHTKCNRNPTTKCNKCWKLLCDFHYKEGRYGKIFCVGCYMHEYWSDN